MNNSVPLDHRFHALVHLLELKGGKATQQRLREMYHLTNKNNLLIFPTHRRLYRDRRPNKQKRRCLIRVPLCLCVLFKPSSS